jgi:metallo-beta-lactamase family protein
MVLSFYGGAQTVTGSKHLITLNNGKRILLDCGLFQGGGAAQDKLNREFGFDPQQVNYLILSHAHIDHSGLIPRLVKLGFTGSIYCTPPTLELCELVLADSARIQQSSQPAVLAGGWQTTGPAEEEQPLYTEEDAQACLSQFVTVPYDEPYRIDEDIELLFTDAGHVIGSAVVNLSLREDGQIRKVCFSGDLGRFTNRILNAPKPCPEAEVVICESTYGDKFHSSVQNTEDKLEEIVREVCVEKGGKLLIPCFSVGRTQELIYSLNCLAEDGRFPDIKVFVDSPMSVYATDLVRKHQECFNEQMLEYIKTDPDPFGFPQLHYITEADDSKLLNALEEPCVIISSSGMMEAGRIRFHLRNYISDPKSAVLVTGYCEPSTLGGKLLNGAEKVTILDEELPVRAEILQMKEYSAHGDYGDIAKFLICQNKEKLKQIFLVHGEKPVMEKLKNDLLESNYANVEIPGYMMSYEV